MRTSLLYLEELSVIGIAERSSRYPWDDWMDGKLHTAVRGIDFFVETSQFQKYVHEKARSVGLQAVTRAIGDTVYFKIVEPGLEETTEQESE